MTKHIVPQPQGQTAGLQNGAGADGLVAIVEGELAELRREGIPIGIDARRLVELEAAGFVVDLMTGAIVDPILPVG